MAPPGFMNRVVRLGRLVAFATSLGLLTLSSGCALPSRLAAVPVAMTVRAQPSIPDVRFYADRDPQPINREFLDSSAKEAAWQVKSGESDALRPVAYLALSGGGSDGAFAAGLLNGWTEAGTRPQFKLVTGVSTGALIAPFAFLGPKWDPALKEAYTQISDKDIFQRRFVTAALFNDAMANTTPMARLIDRRVTRELLDEIAAEYAKGRLLFIGTTNLDTREPVYWNMGAIAASRDPAALALFRKVILASAAIPGVFPPVMIDVTVDGHRYQEMHVDGGATRQMFIYPPRLKLGAVSRANSIERDRKVYIIRNARLDAEWANTTRRTLSITERAVSTLIQTQGMGDLYRMYLTSRRDGIDFNMIAIPPDFTIKSNSTFDPVYMKALYERGREMAVRGLDWQKSPPGFDGAVGQPQH